MCYIRKRRRNSIIMVEEKSFCSPPSPPVSQSDPRTMEAGISPLGDLGPYTFPTRPLPAKSQMAQYQQPVPDQLLMQRSSSPDSDRHSIAPSYYSSAPYGRSRNGSVFSNQLTQPLAPRNLSAHSRDGSAFSNQSTQPLAHTGPKYEAFSYGGHSRDGSTFSNQSTQPLVQTIPRYGSPHPRPPPGRPPPASSGTVCLQTLIDGGHVN